MTTWGPGASVLDVHLMTFSEEHRGYAGSATVAVGLYNPEVPAERVLVSTGGDYVTLPVTLVVTSQQ